MSTFILDFQAGLFSRNCTHFYILEQKAKTSITGIPLRSYQLAHWKIQVSCSDTIPRPRILGPKDEFFLTICRLRQGFKEEHLGHLYGVSQTIVSCMIISWIKFMFLKFSTIPMWPSRTTVDDHMPADFKEKYPSTRVIIDCRGLLSDVRVCVNSELFRSYKNNTTLKGRIGISSGGAIIWKNFHIWDSIGPFTLFGFVNQMWTVCAMLCNFQNSIISS